ncbi:MAG: FHA domain-containing protein [Planctomycetota bacterium]
MVVDEGGPRSDAGALRPLFGTGQGGLAFDLALADDGSDTPFVRLSSGRYSQVLLGTITLGDTVLARQALKVQRHDYLPGNGRALTNPEIDAMWPREAADLRAARSPHVVALAPFPEPFLSSPPVFWCRRTRAWFHPPCPRTGAMLRTCRDDQLLRDAGLPAWSRGQVRYLHAGGADPAFWRTAGAVDERVRDNARVAVGNQLIRDWGAMLRAPTPKAPTPVAPTPVATAAWFPCAGCEHRAECYPAGVAGDAPIPAEQHLHALSYYDFQVLPMELLDLDWGEFSDLLGGAGWSAVKARATAAGAGGRRRVVDRLDRPLGAARQFLFEHDGAQFALEVLQRKTVALQQVCLGLQAVHGRCARPHFALAPQNVMVRWQDPGPGVPPRWAFDVRLIDLGSALPLRPSAPAPGMPRLLEQGHELRGTPYQDALLAAAHDALAGRFFVELKKREAAGDGGRLVLSAEGSVSLRGYRAGDVAQVLPSGASAPWWAQIGELQGNRVVLVVEASAAPDAADWDVGRKFEASLTFFRNHGTPCDLFGLGMLVFRTLLVNDEQDMEAVHKVVDRCLRRIDLAVSTQDEVGEVQARRLVLEQLRLEAKCFDPAALLWHRADRERSGGGADRALWQDLLLLAFQLTTRIPGFSFADSHAEVFPNNPAALMTAVHDRLQQSQRRQQTALFAAAECDREIRALCEEHIEELEAQIRDRASRGEPEPAPEVEAAPRRAAGAAPAGFELTIQEEGGKTVRRAFAQEFVTIGRKKDNLLALENREVSGKHAVIQRIGDTYVVEDLRSTNHTFVNGDRIDPQATLLDGDTIAIGPFQLRFHCAAAAGGGDDAGGAFDAEQTMVHPAGGGRGGRGGLSGNALLEDLRGAFATQIDGDPAERRRALQEVVQERRAANRASAVVMALGEIVDRLEPGGAGDDKPAAQRRDPDLAARTLLAVEAAARALVADESFAFASGQEAAAFCERWQLYTAATLDWLLTATQARRNFTEGVDLDVTGRIRREANPLEGAAGRPAAARLLLQGQDGAGAGKALKRTIDDLQMLLVGLADGGQKVIQAFLDAFAPKQLEADVRSKGGGWVPLTLKPALWDRYLVEYEQFARERGREAERLKQLRDAVLKAHLKYSDNPRANKDST